LETSIDGARAVLINITGGEDISILDINEAANLVMQAADSDANIIFGAGIDESMGDSVRITVIATGFEKTPFPPKEPAKKPYERERERLMGKGSAFGAFGARPAGVEEETPVIEGEEPEIPSFVSSGRPSAVPTGAPAQGQAPYMPAYGAGYQPPQYPAPNQGGFTQAPNAGFAPQGTGFQGFQNQGFQPYQPQAQAPAAPAATEKDDLGVPAFLRRGKK
ncbi:MAG: hypothetical protein IJ461_04315, partial [Clostridia bacterium]|nr:hypothetical protein [Clostridia bacterium]